MSGFIEEHEPEIIRVRADEVRPIRGKVLRPGQPTDRLVYPGDDADSTVHLGCSMGRGDLVAVVSLYNESVPGTDGHAWRIRGMATLREYRGRGFGAALAEAGISLAHGIRRAPVWCNARTSATGYYERLGFVRVGEEFEIEVIGPHFVMVRSADPVA